MSFVKSVVPHCHRIFSKQSKNVAKFVPLFADGQLHFRIATIECMGKLHVAKILVRAAPATPYNPFVIAVFFNLKFEINN